ncbi:MAG: GTP cyclohydrolase FolE2 [Candidatus Cloacimonetes bacterium]|nr:GTP cyclohydrolase FolE2 [Candidatus Cloacimonadota bacterium]
MKIDIQSQNDERNVQIEKVGVKNIKYPICVEDRTNKTQQTIAEIDIYVDLPHDHRGTHMSRFLQVLNSFHGENIIFHLPALLLEVKNQLNSEKAYINIRFPYFVQKTAPVSGLTSLLDYDCVFQASLASVYEFQMGVTVPLTTLCPCSKEISNYGAHNQRSYVTILVRYSDFIWLEELIEIAESKASCEIYPLLKRPDEKYVTEKAFDHPAFAEDIVRDITLVLREDPRIKWFSVESENIESIHNHNAYARIEEQKS